MFNLHLTYTFIIIINTHVFICRHHLTLNVITSDQQLFLLLPCALWYFCTVIYMYFLLFYFSTTLAKNNSIDILLLIETWLDHSVSDCLISIPGYQRPFRRDRQGRRGGGVAIYCADHIWARRRPSGQSEDGRNMFLSHFESSGLSHSLLDLIITNSPGKAVDCDVLPPISNLDHCNIICKFTVSSCLNHNYKRTVWDFKNANMVALNDALVNAPWDVGYDIFIDNVMYWSNLLLQVASDFIPNRVVTVHPKEKPWVNTDPKKMIRRRNLLWRRYKRSGSADHYLNRQLRNVYYSGLGGRVEQSDNARSEMVENSETSHRW